jgi:hypothetical protein
MVLSWKSLGTAVGIDVAIVMVVFFVFNYLRRWQLTSDFYSAKRKLSIPFRCDLMPARVRMCYPTSQPHLQVLLGRACAADSLKAQRRSELEA